MRHSIRPKERPQEAWGALTVEVILLKAFMRLCFHLTLGCA
jgi:hypothetical protein